MKRFVAVLVIIFIAGSSYAQVVDEPVQGGSKPVIGNTNHRIISNKKDSMGLGFQHRDDRKDSISVSYKFIDSVRSINLDSSINDFDKYFSIPSSWQYLGNNGAAAYPLIYIPNARPGFDAGFHAFDAYKFTLEGTKFYKASKPYSQLGYELASGKEQMIKVLHTQNPRPNWNFGFDYRLISAPGFFVTQNSNHKSFRLFSTYQGKHKRYAANIVFIGNTLKNSENGGIQADSLLSEPDRKKRYTVPVNLGHANLFNPSPFLASVHTGNIYKDFTFFLRQSYDIGKKDSVEINDSTTEYLFYPKLRVQYSFTYNTQHYQYRDDKVDSVIYKNWYDTALLPNSYFSVEEKWTVMSNDFSLLQFPDTKNPAQFLLVGATLQNIKGESYSGTRHLYNTMLHGEYRNKTRNKLWDVVAKGEFYLNGFNHGDYSAYAHIDRYLNKKLGDVRLFFKDVNRSPSFIYNSSSSFNFSKTSITKKENIISFGAETNNPFINISFADHIITNLAYFSDYYHIAQSSKLINLLQVSASKKIRLTKRWSLYENVTVQQVDGSAPVKVPLLYTRSRLAYEGVFYKNLFLSAGLEMRYYTPYQAYNYSPVMGQFMPQDSFKLNNLPDISAFVHFRIKSFTSYIRVENLNTLSFKNGFGFTHNNFAAPHYPTPGLLIRIGIQWGFVN